MLYFDYMDSPVGQLLLVANEKGLVAIEFEAEQATSPIERWLPITQASGSVLNYFAQTQSVLKR